MDKSKEVEITYKAMNTQKETTRRIAPYGLFYNTGIWYTIAYCNLRKDIRIFALDSIEKINITSSHYIIPKDFDINKYFEPTWQMLHYGKPVEVVLKFSKEVARWVKRLKWHSSQEIKENKDGSIIFKVLLAGTQEIKGWTFHWIPFCEVIAPKELREEILRDIKALAKVYNKK